METNLAVSDADADTVGFILRLARALHSYGYAAHRMEEVLAATAEHFGLTGEFSATPTSLVMAIGPQGAQQLHMIRGEPGAVDLGRMARIDAVRSQVLHGSLTPAEGSRRLDAIERSPALYSALPTTFAFGLASGAACRFLGGGAREILVASIIGLFIGVLGGFVGKRPRVVSLFEPAGAFIAALIAHLVSVWGTPLSVYIATVAGLIILLPGFTATVAMNELSNRHLVAGTARLTGAFVAFVGIAFGVASGTTVAQLIAGAPNIANAIPAPPWTLWAALVVAPLSFTVLLRAEPKDAPWILATGVAAFLGGQWAGAINEEIGAFVGALLVGLLGAAYARLRNRPSVITLVPGILLLVPGSIGFRSVSSLLDREVIAGVETAFRMVMTVIALVAGLLVANVVAPTRRRI